MSVLFKYVILQVENSQVKPLKTDKIYGHVDGGFCSIFGIGNGFFQESRGKGQLHVE